MPRFSNSSSSTQEIYKHMHTPIKSANLWTSWWGDGVMYGVGTLADGLEELKWISSATDMHIDMAWNYSYLLAQFFLGWEYYQKGETTKASLCWFNSAVLLLFTRMPDALKNAINPALSATAYATPAFIATTLVDLVIAGLNLHEACCRLTALKRDPFTTPLELERAKAKKRACEIELSVCFASSLAMMTYAASICLTLNVVSLGVMSCVAAYYFYTTSKKLYQYYYFDQPKPDQLEPFIPHPDNSIPLLRATI